MRNSWRHPCTSHVSIRSRTALVVAVAMSGCNSATRNVWEWGPAAPMLSFENSTIDQVAVYLDDHGSQWLLGRVQPGQKARLRLPAGALATTGWGLNLVAIPLGTRKDGAQGGEVSTAIRSELAPNEQLTSMRWVLRGRYLIGAIPPRGRA